MTYSGYLAPFSDLLIAGHRQGFTAGDLAEQLYALGARADSSEHGVVLTRQQHHRNLRSMVIYAQIRLGQRVRIPRAAKSLTATARVIGNQTVWEIDEAST
jgi:hypothetical protein